MKKENQNRPLGDPGFALAFGQCIGCKHYDSKNDKCPAFPEGGVPIDIYKNKITHNIVLVNQVGKTIFEAR